MENYKLTENILNAMTDLVLIKGEKSKIKWANDAFLEYYGMTRDELKDLIDADHSDPDVTLQYVKDDATVFATKETLDVPSEPVTNKKGETHYFHTIKSPILDDGKVLQTIGVSRKIHSAEQIKRSEQDQISKKEYLDFQRNFMSNLDLPTIFADAAGRIVFISDAFAKIFNLSSSDFNGKDLSYIFRDETIQKGIFEKKKSDFNKIELSINNNFAYGDLTVLKWFLKDNVPGGRFLLFKNKTEEYKLSNQLESAIKKSIWTDKLKSLGEISAGVGHEINNPLSIILGSIEQISSLKSSTKLSPSISKPIARIEKNVHRIADIVKSLKALSRNTSNDLAIPNKMISVVNEAVTMSKERLKRHEVSLIIDCDESISTKMKTGEIMQVFLNLINNSVDEIRNLNERWVKIECFKKGTDCIVNFSDSGSGVPEELINRIFDPFFTTKPVGEGTGLGLGICHDIISSHGGEITYLSKKLNTTFQIRIPI